jgi:hypothetical protein
MPLIYVEPEVAFKVTQPSSGGRPLNLTVYHVYGVAQIQAHLNGGDPPRDIKELRWKGWYTLNKQASDSRFWPTQQGTVFEIRELPNFKEEHWECDDDHAGVVQQALDDGLVRFKDNELTILNRNCHT